MMKPLTLAAALAGAALALPAWATDVGVSVHVNQPGLYGRIDIGAVPPPPVALIYPQPVVVAATPVVVQQAPVYLHVPPGHAKNWRKHCHKYDACGQRVYFVKDAYYQQHYAKPAPVRHAQGHGGKDDHPGKGHGKGHGKGKDKD